MCATAATTCIHLRNLSLLPADVRQKCHQPEVNFNGYSLLWFLNDPQGGRHHGRPPLSPTSAIFSTCTPCTLRCFCNIFFHCLTSTFATVRCTEMPCVAFAIFTVFLLSFSIFNHQLDIRPNLQKYHTLLLVNHLAEIISIYSAFENVKSALGRYWGGKLGFMIKGLISICVSGSSFVTTQPFPEGASTV